MTADSTEKLAGHAPATMVGGMRVGTNHPKTDRETSPSKELATKENSAETTDFKAGEVVNSRPIKLEDAFPTEAVKHTHDKPHPKHDKPHNNPREQQHQGHLFQPANKSFQ